MDVRNATRGEQRGDDGGGRGRHGEGPHEEGRFGHEGHRGGRDGRFGHRGRAGRGDVRAAALALLAERPLHGYQIMQEIGERSKGVWLPSQGAVYPALQCLEDDGLIRADEVDTRRVYHLTDAGRTYVDGRREELAGVWDAVTSAAGRGVPELHDLAHQLLATVKQMAQVGTEAQIAEAGRVLAASRRQLYRILAEDRSEPSEGHPAAGDA